MGCPESAPVGRSVEGVGPSGLGHFLKACLVGLPALAVVPHEETGLLAVVAAGAGQGLEESGDGHGYAFG